MEEALNSEHGNEWKKQLTVSIHLIEKKTLGTCETTKRSKAIDCKWVFKVK